MADLTHDLARGYFAYTADDTSVYQLATTLQNGLAQSATPVAVGTNPTYPRGWKPRRIYGEDGAGHTTHVPIMDPSNGLWTGDTKTFSKDGVTYTVYGKRGEKRYNRGG